MPEDLPPIPCRFGGGSLFVHCRRIGLLVSQFPVSSWANPPVCKCCLKSMLHSSGASLAVFPIHAILAILCIGPHPLPPQVSPFGISNVRGTARPSIRRVAVTSTFSVSAYFGVISTIKVIATADGFSVPSSYLEDRTTFPLP